MAPRAKFARRRVDAAGKRFPSLKSAAEHFGINYKLAHDRVVDKGWTVAQALEVDPPPASAKFAGVQIKIGRKTFTSIGECARWYGINPTSLLVRMRKYGQSPVDAVAYLRCKPKAGARGTPVSAFGKRFDSFLACAEHHGLHSSSLKRRMRMANETVEQAVAALKRSKRAQR